MPSSKLGPSLGGQHTFFSVSCLPASFFSLTSLPPHLSPHHPVQVNLGYSGLSPSALLPLEPPRALPPSLLCPTSLQVDFTNRSICCCLLPSPVIPAIPELSAACRFQRSIRSSPGFCTHHRSPCCKTSSQADLTNRSKFSQG